MAEAQTTTTADAITRLVRAIVALSHDRDAEAAPLLAELEAGPVLAAAVAALRGDLALSLTVRHERRRAARALLDETADLVVQGDREAALPRAKAALALSPDEPEVYRLLAASVDGADGEVWAALSHALSLELPEDDEAETDDTADRLGVWQRAGRRRARVDWWSWVLTADSLALMVITLPPLIVCALPLAVLIRRLSDTRPELLMGDPTPLVWLAVALGAVAGLWACLTGGCLVAARLVLMVRQERHGRFELDLESLQAGLRLFQTQWWQVVVLGCVAGALNLVLLGSIVLLPLAVFLNACLCFAPALVLLGGRDAFAACSESYRATRGDWVVWLTLQVLTLVPVGLLAAGSVAAPVGLVWLVWARGAGVLVAGLTAAILAHLALLSLAWWLAHCGAWVWLAAYGELYGPEGLAAVATVLPAWFAGESDGAGLVR